MKPNAVGRLTEAYASSRVGRALLKLVPGWGVADTLMNARAEELRHDRLRDFFDQLLREPVVLTEELVQSNEFLFCFLASLQAAERSRRVEKARLFAALLKSAAVPGEDGTLDEFDEYLAVLDELTYRELRLLLLLDAYETAHPQLETENELQRASRFWSAFEADAQQRLGMTPEQLAAALTRLNRSGCYATITGTFVGYKGGRGHLTVTYWRLKELVAEGLGEPFKLDAAAVGSAEGAGG